MTNAASHIMACFRPIFTGFCVGLCAFTWTIASSAQESAEKKSAVPEDFHRSWLYLDEPSAPSPWHVVTLARTTYMGSALGPSRPFASNLAREGVTGEVGAELGVFKWLAVSATGMVGSLDGNARPGAMAGAKLIPLRLEHTTLAVTFGYLHETGDDSGVFARASFVQEFGRARFGATVHVEKLFDPKRDAVDVMAQVGASVRVHGPLRANIEYVAQDFEGIGSDDAEGGYKHFLGAGIAFELLERRLGVTLGPAITLMATGPKPLGRAAITYAF